MSYFRVAARPPWFIALAFGLAACSGTSDGDAPDAPVLPAIPAPAEAPSPPSADAPPPDAVEEDVLPLLRAIPGVVAEEVSNDAAHPVPLGFRRYDFTFDQPADHEHPGGPRFAQRVSLLHRSVTAPMVLSTSGYGLRTGRSELVRDLIDANQLSVEHRFFTPSVPAPVAWTDLTIRQSAADFHAIVVALRGIYKARWIGTGVSKGGMTSVFHRRFYPDDLDGTVAYVAPLMRKLGDERFTAFLGSVGGGAYATCRQRLATFQRTVLVRRSAVVAKMEGNFAAAGGPAYALERAVLGMPFRFWQYQDPKSATFGCGAIPAPNATTDLVYAYVKEVAGLADSTDTGQAYYFPYYYQAATELGTPAGADASHLTDVLGATPEPVPPGPEANVPTTFSPGVMQDVDAWVRASGRSLMFVYGELDPWSSARFELGDAADSFRFTAPGANHGASIASLSDADRERALDALSRWAGVKVRTPAPSTLVSAPRGREDDDVFQPPL